MMDVRLRTLYTHILKYKWTVQRVYEDNTPFIHLRLWPPRLRPFQVYAPFDIVLTKDPDDKI